MASKTFDDKAKFVFDGVVKSLSSKKGVKTAVVKIGSVLRSPQVLADAADSTVAVLLRSEDAVGKGAQATFYANPMSWGDTVTVQSVGVDTARGAPPAPTGGGGRRSGGVVMAAAASPPPVRNLADKELEERVAQATMVVSGKVSVVKVPDDAPPAMVASGRRGAAAEILPAPPRISEHDPMWREAVIDVTDTHKGQQAKQVVVRFAKSNDVRWRNSPKFQTGQTGVFMLHGDDIKGSAREATALAATRRGGRRSAGTAAAAVPAYSALSTADVQPMEQEAMIKSLIQSSKGGN